MSFVEAATLRRAACEAIESGRDRPAGCAAVELLAMLSAHGDDGDTATRETFRLLLGRIAMSYFGQDWAPEHEFSVWARLTDDARAWGYGSEDEIAGPAWLVEVSGLWFDGQDIVSLEAWRPRFEAWASAQQQLVRRMTPGALSGELFEGRGGGQAQGAP